MDWQTATLREQLVAALDRAEGLQHHAVAASVQYALDLLEQASGDLGAARNSLAAPRFNTPDR